MIATIILFLQHHWHWFVYYELAKMPYHLIKIFILWQIFARKSVPAWYSLVPIWRWYIAGKLAVQVSMPKVQDVTQYIKQHVRK